MNLLDALFIVIACIVLIAFGAGVSYFFIRQSRVYDVKVLKNLHIALTQCQNHLIELYSIKTGTPIPGVSSRENNFGGRTDEDEAAIEDMRG